MARKFITMDEAATMLGVTAETLAELRDRRAVHGYRDGASWKFKAEDIERLKAERESEHDEGEYAEIDEDPDSILLSEVELGQSGESTSSTIIGGKANPKDPLESDIQIAPPKHDSDVLDEMLLDSERGGSDVLTGPSTGSSGSGSGVSPMFDELDTLDLDMPSAADSGISTKSSATGSSPLLTELAGGSALELGEAAPKSPSASGTAGGSGAGTSDISLSLESLELQGSGLSFGEDQDLALGEDQSLELKESKAGGSDIDLTGDFDDDLVLGGSSHGDLSRTGDSGISLLDPADSGISLEAPPLELGGSNVEQLELGEDDLLGDLQPAAGGPAASAALSGIETPQSDDDFLLTPLEEGVAEESDSGSQVIALESDVEFDEAGVGTLEPEGGLLEEDLGAGLGGAAALETVGAGPSISAAAAAAPAGAATAMVPDTPFTGWNVTSLVLCAVLLMFCGMFMYDLMRNMWSWDGAYSVNSSMMEMILSWFE
ncbi:MAG: helix-turn-helix domain-containing protein [Pirellulales bacterium]